MESRDIALSGQYWHGLVTEAANGDADVFLEELILLLD
jgi:hypothetical protein